ncbi:MAG: hypothetical protein AAGA56_19540, partial [Myxococcota bacterium]
MGTLEGTTEMGGWTIVHGELSELVMSAYGLSRLLKSRQYGPAQLVPAASALASELDGRRERLAELFRSLESSGTNAHLVSSVEVARAAAERVFDQLDDAFGSSLRFGARQRLRLEREVPELGRLLQGLRSLLFVLDAGYRPRLTPLRLRDFMAMTHAAERRPIFSDLSVQVLLHNRAEVAVFEPGLVRGWLEEHMRRFGKAVCSSIDVRGDQLSVRPLDCPPEGEIAAESGETLLLSFSPRLPEKAAVLQGALAA